jgi:hypothetical protein
MDPGLLNHWASNLKTLLEWEEAFLVFKWCLQAFPPGTRDLVTINMLSAKKQSQWQAQDARMPACALFLERGDTKTEGFMEVPCLTTASPFKPSVSTLNLSGKST